MRQRQRSVGLAAAWVAVGAGIAGALAQPAWAGLGEGAESLARDRAAVHAGADQVTPMVAYDLHEVVTPDGGTVREYVSRSGVVFGVAWVTRTKPDLSALLGSHYADYLAATQRPHADHKVLSIESEGFVMHLMKLPRGFAGSAHVPALLPAGVGSGVVR